MNAKDKPNEIRLTRLYDAPIKTVWEAWTDPKQVVQWWGPRGFSLTIESMDVRTGGSWGYTMHGPDGVDHRNVIRFLEVEKHARLVYDLGGSGDQPPLFRVTVRFSESAGKTLMEMGMAFPTAEAAAETRKIIKKADGYSTWDRLAEHLALSDRFVLNRSFEIARDRMFEIWTDPKHVAHWLPPAGFTMKYLRAEIRTGGSAFYCMSGPGNMKMYGKAEYKEVSKPHRLVYTQVFCDENEKTTRHPMSPTWPEVMLTTVALAEEGPDRTRVTITWEVYGNATAAERETFNQSKGGMTQGWGGSLDKLEDYLAQGLPASP